MVRIRFMFYHAKWGDGKWLDNAISIWTSLLSLLRLDLRLLGFSHEEVLIPDEEGSFENGVCFSSTTRGGSEGVRFAPAKEVLKHPERWSYIEVPVSAEDLEVAMAEAQKLIGMPYDYWGIAGFVCPIVKQRPDEWYCSEVSHWFARLCKVVHKPRHMVSPLRKAQILIGMGYKLRKCA